MPDTRTSDETAASALTGVELIRIVQGGNMRKAVAALLGHQFRGARAVRTTNQTAANYTTSTPIPFESADVDTDGFWSAGTPSRLTIPDLSADGWVITHVGVSAACRVDLVTSDQFTQFAVIHASSAGTSKSIAGNMANILTTTTKFVSACMAMVPVVVGDFFTGNIQQQTDTSITVNGANGQTHLSLVVLGMEPV